MDRLQVKAEAVRREEERAKKLKAEEDRKAEIQQVGPIACICLRVWVGVHVCVRAPMRVCSHWMF